MSLVEIRETLERELDGLRLSDEEIRKMIAGVTEEVDRALKDESYLSTFRGKDLLRGVYEQLGLGASQVAFERFAYTLARTCREKQSVRELLAGVFDEIDRRVQEPQQAQARDMGR